MRFLRMKSSAEIIDVVRKNWRAEIDSARAYRELAAAEANAKRRDILLRMAEAEERHANRWQQKLAELGVAPEPVSDTLGDRINRWWNRLAGTGVAIRRMEAAEDRH